MWLRGCLILLLGKGGDPILISREVSDIQNIRLERRIGIEDGNSDETKIAC